MQQQQRQQTGGRGKATGFLVVALAVAGLLTFVVWKTFTGLQQQVAKAKEGPERVRVLVASRDIYMGEAITEGDVEVMAHLPELIYSERVFAEDQLGQLLNRTAKERILQGEVLREERLANADQGEGLNALIPRGLRAMTIDVDPESSLAGLLQPGNRVDVIVTIRPDDRNIGAKWVTQTILQDKRVLAIGDRLRPTSAAEKAEEGKKRGPPQAAGRDPGGHARRRGRGACARLLAGRPPPHPPQRRRQRADGRARSRPPTPCWT